MKRPAEDDAPDSALDSKAEEVLGRFFERHPRFFLYAGIGLGALVIVVIIAVKVSNH
jgi:hypothetical protein